MAYLTKQITVDAEHAGRVDLVVKHLTGLPRSQIRGLFDHDCVSVNGERCIETGAPVAVGDVVEAVYDPHTRYHEKPRAWEDDAFSIVHEDAHLIVVNKSADVLTVPAQTGESGTLVQAVAAYFAHRGARERAYLVHRLDRGASGLLVFGKSREIAEQLQSQFEERKPEREYQAIVHGEVGTEGTFETYLTSSKSLQMYSTEHPGEGQLAITHFRRVKVVRGASWVRVWLETGRRNQIRVHFAEAGHPVLGDPRYSPDLSSHSGWRAKRLALHAGVLGFRHPATGKALRFESPMPTAMKTFVGEKQVAAPPSSPRKNVGKKRR